MKWPWPVGTPIPDGSGFTLDVHPFKDVCCMYHYASEGTRAYVYSEEN